MKKFTKILLPILLSVAILFSLAWYLFVYDRAFARDMLLNFARFSEDRGYHSTSTWFYNLAYSHAEDRDAVAIELAQQYKKSGNFTKAEFTLSNAIADGGGIDLYIALCQTYVEQDKLLDAVNMLNNITNTEIKAQLDAMRPEAPTSQPAPGFYSQYISVTIDASSGQLLINENGQYPSVKNGAYSAPITLKDGNNTIYAISVADNGLVSPVSIFGYTVGGIIEELEFCDSAMESEIRKLLGVDADKTLMTNDLWNITEFTVPEAATDYAELKHMPFLTSLTITKGSASQLSYIANLSNLETLTVTDTAVSQDHLASIAKLPSLKVLTLQNCNLSGISVLAEATSVTTLNLSKNTIQNVDALSQMKSLKEANLQHNAITSVAPLAGVTALEKLEISYNNLASIAPLADAKSLLWLNASNNVINDLGSLGKATTLTYLSLENNKISNISTIAGCLNLTELNIAENNVSDISKLSALTKMMYFNFSNNKVKELPGFPKDCALVVITGNHNNIKSLDALSGLKNLNTVNMDYNSELSSLKPLTNCDKLVEVNVYGTKVREASALIKASVIVNFTPVS